MDCMTDDLTLARSTSARSLSELTEQRGWIVLPSQECGFNQLQWCGWPDLGRFVPLVDHACVMGEQTPPFKPIAVLSHTYLEGEGLTQEIQRAERAGLSVEILASAWYHQRATALVLSRSAAPMSTRSGNPKIALEVGARVLVRATDHSRFEDRVAEIAASGKYVLLGKAGWQQARSVHVLEVLPPK